MPIETTLKKVNDQTVSAHFVFRCDRPGCNVRIEWNATPTGEMPHQMNSTVTVVAGKKLIFCSDECTIVAVNAGQHHASKVSLANDADAQAAIQGTEQTRKLQVVE